MYTNYTIKPNMKILKGEATKMQRLRNKYVYTNNNNNKRTAVVRTTIIQHDKEHVSQKASSRPFKLKFKLSTVVTG